MDHSEQAEIHKLALLNWNANGISSKRLLFIDFLVRHNIDIACITETHLVSGQNFKVPNYRVYRSNRTSGEAWGGVAVIIKKNLCHEPIILSPMVCFEIQGIKVSLKNGSCLRIFSAYRSKKPLSIRDLNCIFNVENTPTMIVGDLNCKHPAWFSVTSNPNGLKLFNLMNRSEWIVIGPEEPTYYPEHIDRHPDVLDILVCKNVPGIMSQQVMTAELPSDHRPVIIQLDAVLLQYPPRLKLINGPVDWDVFRDKVDANLTIPSVFDSPDSIDDAVDDFTNLVKHSVYLSSGPAKTHSYKFVLPFHLRSLISYKHRVRRRWQRNHIAADKTLLNNLSKNIKKQLDEYWYENYQEYLEDLHPDDGSLYKETKRILRQRDIIPPIKVDSDQYLTSPSDKCEAFADMLEETFSVNEDSFNSPHITWVKQSLSEDWPSVDLPIPYVSPTEVSNEIQHLKRKKSPGHDLIPNEIIKEFPFRAILFLTALFNACLRWNYFPYNWKHAQVTMIPKPGKPKNNLSSYRPISLLPTLSKLLEKLIAFRLRNVLLDWNVLPPFQFGFREGHSTVDQMVKFSEFLNLNFENHNQTAALFLDFKQAFDRVWHDGLIYKMKKLQFPQYLIGIIASFLKERSFSVKLEENYSTIRPVLASVPQGSVLGPILFNLYVSDIVDEKLPIPSSCFLGMFADDKLIACSDPDIHIAQSSLQNLVDIIVQWCSNWCVTISIQKSEAKIFSLRRCEDPPCITISNESIEWKKTSVRWLGVWFDKRLTWSDHISTKVSEAYQRLSKLFPLLNKKSSLRMKAAVLIYKSILLPVISYGCPVWMAAAESHIRKLQIFQNKVLRIITHAPWFVRNADIMKDLKINPVRNTLIQRCVTFLQDNPHDVGRRHIMRRRRVHLPQDLPDIVNALAEAND